MSDIPPVSDTSIGPDQPSAWLFMLRRREERVERRLREIYGENDERIEQRREILLRLLDEFVRRHSDSRAVWLVRAPGRLTTLAMHIDHRGGYLNALCLQQEVLLVCRNRKDDAVLIHNLRGEFGSREFRISDTTPDSGLKDTQQWLDWTSQLAAERAERGERHDWVYKVAAPAAYLQYMYRPDEKVEGFEAVVSGDVPIGGGLSSSSALVVACTEALLASNKMQIPIDHFAHHCGVAEWFVGTRGGCGDHAAIKYGRAGHLTHMRTEPDLILADHPEFPPTHRFVVFHSGIVANKTGEAGQRFNEKTATYALGEMYMRRWLRAHKPEFFESLWRARESNPVDKRVFLADVVEALDDDEMYGLLDDIPERSTRAELRREWGGDRALLESYFRTHYEPEAYELRAVVTYGLAACDRARRVRQILAEGDVERFGEWMNISHDADRVSHIADDVADRKQARDRSLPVHLQSGDYHCSIPDIDHMVDTARSAGAVGAQIAGAGMGGSMIALVPAEAEGQVIEALRREYKTPTGTPPMHFVADPCSGSCVF